MQPRRRPLQLLDLPNELLWHIFSFLQNDKAGKRAICRRLQPMIRRNAFQIMGVDGPTDLARLMSILYDKPERLSKRAVRGVRTLPRLIDTLYLWTGASGTEATKKRAIRHGDVSVLLSAATSIRTLYLSHRAPLDILFPDPVRHTAPVLPRLQSLQLASQYGFAEPPEWDADKLARLVEFSLLQELVVDLGSSGRASIKPFEDESDLAPIEQVHSLELIGGLCLASRNLPPLIALFTGLRELRLVATDLCVSDGLAINLSPLLRAVSIEHLTTLELRPDDEEEDPNITDRPNLTIEADLGRFCNLTSLRLGGSMFDPDGALLDILVVHVPTLERLHFGRHAYITAAKLAVYMCRAERLALREICIDIFDGHFSGMVPSLNPDHPQVWNGTYDLAESSDRPRWQPDFTYEDAGMILLLGGMVGVEVTGDLREAMDVEIAVRMETGYLEYRYNAVLYDIRELFEPDQGAGTAK